jgi:hypothetical protein
MHVDRFVRGVGKFMITEYVPTDERTGPRFPLILTTGRILSQYNVGAQTLLAEGIVQEVYEGTGAALLPHAVHLTRDQQLHDALHDVVPVLNVTKIHRGKRCSVHVAGHHLAGQDGLEHADPGHCDRCNP